jgi:thiol:disulfide interchange protein
MNRSVLLILGLVAVVAYGAMTYRSPDSSLAAGEGPIAWMTSLDKAQKLSQSEDKPIFLYFTAEWCGPCKQMKATTLRDDRVVAAMEGYIPVMIDVDDQPSLAAAYQVRGVPTTLVLNHAGHPVKGLVGGVSASDLVEWLDSGRIAGRRR